MLCAHGDIDVTVCVVLGQRHRSSLVTSVPPLGRPHFEYGTGH
jgi:hypothetical protein